jgi:RNA polymerase sigma factor (sigma-70 family)
MKPSDKIFIEALERNRHRIARICRAYTGKRPDSEDLFQEIILNIWKSLSSFRGNSGIDTWIYRVAINTALMFHRTEGRRVHRFIAVDDDSMLELPAPDTPDSNDAEIKRLMSCIAKLLPRDRLIVSLILEGFSYKEIADVIGTTTGNIGVIFYRIKTLLTGYMEGEFSDDQ